MSFRRSLKTLFTFFFIIVGIWSACAQENGGIATVQISGSNDLSGTIEKILPTVVNISTVKADDYVDVEEGYYEDNLDEGPRSLGSGFLISEDGYIVTNNHVIEDADSVLVTLKGSSTKFPADVIGVDKRTDLALLKISVKVKLPHIEFDKENSYKVGDQIIVVGNPYNLGTSVSIGIISALNREVESTSSSFNNFIQTDAAINKGNSGGPMFNLEGKVIGITSSIYSPDGANVGIGFAIPTANALPVIEKLKRDGFVRRGWFGITAVEANKEILKALDSKSRNGVLVTGTVKDGPAAKAGIKVSDVIISYNGTKIKRLKDLPAMVSATEIGSIANVVIFRNGKYLRVKAQIEESKEDYQYDSEYEAMAGGAVEIFDMYVLPVSSTVKKRFKLDDKKGLFVLKIKKSGLAFKKGIENNDVILSVNQTEVNSKEQLIQAFNKIKANKGDKAVLIIKKYNSNKKAVILMPVKSNRDGSNIRTSI